MEKRTKVALITGITGQDGSYLAEFLLNKGYKVVGLMRPSTNSERENIKHLGSTIKLVMGDLVDQISLFETIRKYQPDEIYNLAAQSHVGVSWKQPIQTGEVTGLGPVRIFEAVRNLGIFAKIYQASTSEMFGHVKETPQSEKTPFNPANPYASYKLMAHTMAKVYRESYGMFISCGILFNHESSRRGMNFVSQKITYGAACIKAGVTKSEILNEEGDPIIENGKLSLGNLEAKRDWGYVGDYVEAMWLMLQQNKPDDFIIATGKTHTVREFCKLAFDYVGLDYRKYVQVDKRLVRPTETGPLVGDFAKARKELGWRPKTSFKGLVEMMVDAHLQKLRKIR